MADSTNPGPLRRALNELDVAARESFPPVTISGGMALSASGPGGPVAMHAGDDATAARASGQWLPAKQNYGDEYTVKIMGAGHVRGRILGELLSAEARPSVGVSTRLPAPTPPQVEPGWWGTITFRYQGGHCTLVETTETRKP